jgi:hypothetical protein
MKEQRSEAGIGREHARWVCITSTDSLIGGNV